LFSTFPSGRPGAGLLLLRVCAGIPLILEGMFELRASPHFATVTIPVGAVVVGFSLIAGLWTPFVGAFQAIMEFYSAFSRGNDSTLHLLLAALGISLIMLGPGAWSLDARLFGRKRIDIT
jgi:putative oxidoreductase